MTPRYLIVHHSFTPKDLAANSAESSFNNSHRSRGFPVSASGWYIGYHYVIYGNGELRKYRNDNEIGAHTKEQNMNFQSLGICLSGNFDSEQPNPAQVQTLRNLLREKMQAFNIPAQNIYPHRTFATYKSCYGTLLSNTWARELVAGPSPIPTPTPSPALQVDTLIINYKGKFGLIINYSLTSTILWATDKEMFKALGQIYRRTTVNNDGSFAPADINVP